MATRYWIGETGSTGDTAHWSLTSGGAGGASVPTQADTAIFDVNSFSLDSQIVTVSSGSHIGTLIIESDLDKIFTISGVLLLITTLLHIKTSLDVVISVPIKTAGELVNDNGAGVIASFTAINGCKISGDNTITNLMLSPVSEQTVLNYIVDAIVTFEGGTTCTVEDLSVVGISGPLLGHTMTIDSDDEYSPFTISCASGKIELESTIVKNCIADGGATFEALTSMFCVDGGGNTGWNFAPYSPRYWVGNAGNWNDIAHWSLTSGGTGGASVPTFANDVIFNSNSFSSNNQIVDVGSGYCASFIVNTGAKSFKLGYYPSVPEILMRGDLTINNVSCTLCRMTMETDGTISGMLNCHLSCLSIGNRYYENRVIPTVTLTDGEIVNIDHTDTQSLFNVETIAHGLQVYGKFYFSGATFNIGGVAGTVNLFGNTRGMEIHNTSGNSIFNITSSYSSYGAGFLVGDAWGMDPDNHIIDLPDTTINITGFSGGYAKVLVDVEETTDVTEAFIDCEINMKSSTAIILSGDIYCGSLELDVDTSAALISGGLAESQIYIVNDFTIVNTSAASKPTLSGVHLHKDSGTVSLSNTILSSVDIYGWGVPSEASWYALYANGCVDAGSGVTANSILWVFGKPKNLSISPTLVGITSDIQLTHTPDWKDISVAFSISKYQFEDISVVFEYCSLDVSSNIFFTFEVVSFGTYNFKDISVLFQITTGVDYSDVPFHFSVIKQPQNFMSYIFQKLYCVTTEVISVHDDIQLQNWNVKPNQTWFVMVDDTYVYLYETLDDLTNETNCVAQGEIDSETLEVILYYLDEYEGEDGEVDYYYTDYPAHLTVSAIPSGTRTFKVKPLTDMAEIRHAIYNNSNITISRGEAELNLHTYAVKGREVVLGTHLPELECGDTVDLTSIRRNKSAEKSQILSQTIVGEVGDGGETSLITTINVANYTELYR